MKTTKKIRARLEYLRGEIQAEKISQGEIAELQSLADHIKAGDVELLQWAGVPENRGRANKLKTFTVVLNHSQSSRAEVVIEARNMAAAEEMAEEIRADEIDDWNPYDGEVEVCQVRVGGKKAKPSKFKPYGGSLPGTPNNSMRAHNAELAIAFTGNDAEDTTTNIVDTLANIHHLCHREGIDFAVCLKSATMHYEAEA